MGDPKGAPKGGGPKGSGPQGGGRKGGGPKGGGAKGGSLDPELVGRLKGGGQNFVFQRAVLTLSLQFGTRCQQDTECFKFSGT